MVYKVVLWAVGEAPKDLMCRAKVLGADFAITPLTSVGGTKWYALTIEAATAMEELKFKKLDSATCEHAFTSPDKYELVVERIKSQSGQFEVVG